MAHPYAPNGAHLGWNHETHHVVMITHLADGRPIFHFRDEAFYYQDGTATMTLLEVAERVDGRWLCTKCTHELPDSVDVCACRIDDRPGPDDPF